MLAGGGFAFEKNSFFRLVGTFLVFMIELDAEDGKFWLTLNNTPFYRMFGTN